MIEDYWFPQININRCTGCGDCVAACPTGALALVADLAVLAEPAVCSYSGECELVCPEGAIALPYQIIVESDG